MYFELFVWGLVTDKRNPNVREFIFADYWLSTKQFSPIWPKSAKVISLKIFHSNKSTGVPRDITALLSGLIFLRINFGANRPAKIYPCRNLKNQWIHEKSNFHFSIFTFHGSDFYRLHVFYTHLLFSASLELFYRLHVFLHTFTVFRKFGTLALNGFLAMNMRYFNTMKVTRSFKLKNAYLR